MRRRKSAIFFVVLGICLSALAIALNIGWILLNVREVAILILGIVFFAIIITGLVLNTIFLVREIKKSEQHDAFLNAVTHELKTPLASIRLYLETLMHRDVSPEKRREFYDVMLADSNRLLNTVEQVLSASKTAETKKQFNVSEVSLAETLDESAAIVRSRYNLEGGEIRVGEMAKDVTILADPEELQTAFMNLIDNAVKYSGDDPKVVIRVKPSTIRNRVDIFIRDNGAGIDQSDLKRIFKRFHRASSEKGRKVKGTGLGLFIVNSIIKRHGGSVRAESKGLGSGSTFIVQLPRL